MELHIFKDKDPILREATDKVDNFDMELQDFIDNMIETMRTNKGIGLAAPQVGRSKKILVCEFEGTKEDKKDGFPLTVICNPEIIEKSKTCSKMVEGCLSFPGMELVVERPNKITIKGKDRYGEDIEIEAGELYAKVLQHESDHLNSTLLIDHLREMKVVFFGGGEFGLDTLELLNKDPQYIIEKVYTTKQTALTRGKKEDSNKIIEKAKKLKLDYKIVKSLKNDKIIDEIKKTKAELGIVVDFGLIIPEKVFSIPEFGVLNIHPSLLPKYRGPSPIQSTILGGDKKTGVSIIKIDQGVDSGDIIAQTEIKLKKTEAYPILKEFLAKTGASLLVNSIPYYIAGEITPKKQNHEKATFTKMFIKSDGEVGDTTLEIEVDRKVRALNPWPGVFTFAGKKRIKILSTHKDREEKLVIDRVQPEGKNEMTYAEYLNGRGKELTFKE